MKGQNPFSISFGRVPVEYIRREDVRDRVLSTFLSERVTDQIFMLVGARGTGKTVALHDISAAFASRSDWIVVSPDTGKDMAENFYSDLYRHKKMHHFSTKISAQVAVSHTRVSISSEAPEATVKARIEDLLTAVLKRNRRVLVIADEVSNTEGMQEFFRIFQDMVGKNLPVYFLGTAIYENMEELRNVKNLTFLYRAPRIDMKPLDMLEIAAKYRSIFEITQKEAAMLALLTKGYSFAFQALGYVCWENERTAPDEELLDEYDRLLTQSSYSKIWTELSAQDKEVCRAIAAFHGEKVKTVRESLKMDSNTFTVYRHRLKEKGILDTREYGHIDFALPRFSEFVNERAVLYG